MDAREPTMVAAEHLAAVTMHLPQVRVHFLKVILDFHNIT